MGKPAKVTVGKLRLKGPIANGARPSQECARYMGELIRDDMIKGIRAQRTLDNQPLKSNAETTRVRKMAEGKKPLSLIDEEHRLISPASYKIKPSPNGVAVDLRPDVRKIAENVHDRGYRGWWGLGPRVLKPIMDAWRQEVMRLLTGKGGK